MSEFEVFFKNEGSEYGDGIVLNKYGDRYGIYMARESKTGTVYKDWCFPQDKDKSIPMGVRLGNYTEAVATLKAVLAALEKPAAERVMEAARVMGGKVVDQEDIPF